MFRFEHPHLFWLMILPVMVGLLLWLRKDLLHRHWSRWGSQGSNERIRTQIAKPAFLWLMFAGLSFLSLSAVNPQWGFKKRSVENRSADIFIVLDISNSMLAEDLAPNRLERAKRMALDISSAFKTDKVGLILFAGNAYIQSPLTTDWHAIQLFINAANPDQAGTQGTAIGDAVRLVLKSAGNEGDHHPGAMVILTDGEDHDSDAEDAIRDASDAGWMAFVIGTGTASGSTIPVMYNGSKDVKRDEHGQPVQTRLNEPLMKALADKGHGRYYNLNQSTSIVDDLRRDLSALERTQLEKRSFSEHKSYYQWLLLPGLLLLMIGGVLNYKFDLPW